MKKPLGVLSFGGGSVGNRIKNLSRKNAPVWLTAIAAVLCLCLAGWLLTDREKGGDMDLDMDRDMRFSGLYTRILVAEDGETVYFPVTYRRTMDKLLYVLDVPSGVVTPLCTRPECRHDSGACNAWLGTSLSFQLYDGAIWFNDRNEIYRMDLDGRNRELAAALDTSLFYGDTGASGNIFFHRGMIFHAMVGDVVEEGVWGQEVRAYALPTDGQREPEVILQKRCPGTLITMEAQPAGDWFYICLNYRDRDSQTDDPEYSVEICRWSLTDRSLETVYTASRGDVTLSGMWAEEDTVVFIGREKDGTAAVYALDIASGELARREVLGGSGEIYDSGVFGGWVVVCRRQENGDHRDEDGRFCQDPDHWDMLVTVTDLEGHTLHKARIAAPEFPESEDGTVPWRSFALAGLSGDWLYAKYDVGDGAASAGSFQLVRVSLTEGRSELLGGWTRNAI